MSRLSDNNTNRNDMQSNVSDNKRGNRWLVVLLSVTCIVMAILLVLMTVERCSSKKGNNAVVVVVDDSASKSGDNTVIDNDNHKSGGSTVNGVSHSEGSKGSTTSKSSSKNTKTTTTTTTTKKNSSDANSDDANKREPSKLKKFIVNRQHNQNTTISNKTILFVSVAVFVSLLVCNIVARVRSKRNLMVVTVNWIDAVLMYLAPILFFVAWCIGFEHNITQTQLVIISLSGLALLASFGFSIWANLGSALNIGLSIFAKLFIFVLTFILLLLLIAILVFILFFSMLGDHDDNNDRGPYAIEYDEFLDRWVCYRI